jgi:hypothetical protein
VGAGGGARVTGFIGGGLGHEHLPWGSGPHWRQVGQMRGVASIGGGSHKQEVGTVSQGQAGGGAGAMGFIGGGLGHERLPRGNGPHWRQVGQRGVARELWASLEASRRAQGGGGLIGG